MTKSILVFLIALVVPFHSMAASMEDIERMTSYASILGRAIGCGVSIDSARYEVGVWFERTFPPGSSEYTKYTPIFLSSVKRQAQQQISGQNQETCLRVSTTLKKMSW